MDEDVSPRHSIVLFHSHLSSTFNVCCGATKNGCCHTLNVHSISQRADHLLKMVALRTPGQTLEKVNIGVAYRKAAMCGSVGSPLHGDQLYWVIV